MGDDDDLLPQRVTNRVSAKCANVRSHQQAPKIPSQERGTRNEKRTGTRRGKTGEINVPKKEMCAKKLKRMS